MRSKSRTNRRAPGFIANESWPGSTGGPRSDGTDPLDELRRDVDAIDLALRSHRLRHHFDEKARSRTDVSRGLPGLEPQGREYDLTVHEDLTTISLQRIRRLLGVDGDPALVDPRRRSRRLPRLQRRPAGRTRRRGTRERVRSGCSCSEPSIGGGSGESLEGSVSGPAERHRIPVSSVAKEAMSVRNRMMSFIVIFDE